MSSALPPSIEKLIESLQILPGVGQKTAARLAFFLLRSPESTRDKLGLAILNATKNLLKCEVCGHFSESPLCDICQDEKRLSSEICVIEDSLDLLAIEKTRTFRGRYHVLGGALAPLDGIGPDDLRINELIERLTSDNVQELIFATNPTLEGEATAALLQRKCAPFPHIKITRLARGIPVGSDVEYTDEVTLARAFDNRTIF